MNLARLMTTAILKLPKSILIRMAGSPPLEIDDRTLDLRMHFISTQASKQPPISEATPEQARAAAHDAFKLTNANRQRGIVVRDDTIPAADNTPLPVRHYRPKKAKGAIPGVVYFHMGGWVIGDLDTCDQLCSLISSIVGAHVMSVDYRLAPEHKFPTAMEDGFAAYLWLRDNAQALEIDSNRIAVGGDSAGGCMTAVLCQEMKRRGKPQPKVQMLIYPATDFTDESDSMASCGNCQPLTTEVMEWFSKQWLNDESERTNPLASPMLGNVDKTIAPALIVTAGFDPLRDQGAAYVKKIREAGGRVNHYCEDGLCHAFTAYAGLVPEAARANKKIAYNLNAMI